MRAKITMTAVREYHIHQEYYPKGMSGQEMIELDLENIKRDPESFFDKGDAVGEIQVKAEIIKE